ncbi:hypothetical protein PN36_11060 [Candidatus Thiomargarita nelsonii]|uniref:Rubrerythrin diiron-binding domain-containing protein n=1 Tax=Candidatus Thiomargarita nelsonii TaxID=1003181 RepID=A0A0A6P8X8_9GAMM|nr:hypothetical protein PN36_11060 [Candidatus Thiomargarita nelsonii]
MAYNFNADDVFEMAEQMESNGAKFYRSTADLTDNEELKKLFNHLADMEIAHQNFFKSLREDLSEKEKAATVFDPNDEATLYLQELVNSRVSFENEYEGNSIKSILEGAIKSEKDTIAFYQGIKEAVPEDLGKNQIDKIIKEEMAHVRILSQEVLKLKD